MVAVVKSLQFVLIPIPPQISSSSSSSSNKGILTRRSTILFTAASVLAPYLQLLHPNSKPSLSSHSAIAQQQDELDPDEDHVVHLFQDTSPSVVFIKDLELAKSPKSSSEEVMLIEDENVKVEGTGSGFIWDKFGHIVTNYHVVEKLATDRSGLQRCKVFLVDAKGNSFSREAKIVGFDPAYDLAVLKVDVEGNELKPVILGTSRDLHVGQSCFAIGNPYGYEDTLTTGVVSGLGREIPSPNGQAIRGAIQTDAAINSGNSGGPLIDSYGHVIGVNTATFTLRGTGVSSGVNFAIPIDTVVRTIPSLIVYGTPYKDRYYPVITVHGFGYDESIDDYKVVLIFQTRVNHREYQGTVAVYTLRTDSWRRIRDCPHPLHANASGKFASGALHWIGRVGIEDIIVSLDLAKEIYGEVLQLDYIDSKRYLIIDVLGGCLCMLCRPVAMMD